MSGVNEISDEDLDLLEVSRILWKGWRVIVLMTVAFSIVAVVVALNLQKKYEAVTVLSPVMDDPAGGRAGGISSALGSLGGLSSLVGLSAQSGSMRANTIATLQSEILTERYIRENNLIGVLLGGTSHGFWFGGQKSRTLWAANAAFDKSVRKITENTRSGLVTLSIRWKDPVEASRWANGLVRLTNIFLRDKAIADSERNIEYLNEQLAKTNVVELRTAIYTLMESEIKKEMLARGSDEYALKVIDPASVPEKPIFPVIGLWMAAAALVGFTLGCAYVLVAERLRQPRRSFPS